MKFLKIYSFIVCMLVLQPSPLQSQTIAAGGWHSLVVCNDGTVKAFGENASGQLGNGSTADSNVPVNVGTLNNIISVSAGGDQLEAHSLALRSDGTIWSWGSNLYGGLGNGSTSGSTIPVQTFAQGTFTAISAGGWHSAAIRNDRTVWTWGWNMDGQLGDGSTNDRTIPAQVPGLTDVIQIAAGTYHTLALKANGTVWAWGDNFYGQVGNGTFGADIKTPIQVMGLNNVVKIAAGRFFSLAVKNDGTLWTWGQNLYGQLGDGTYDDRTVPVQVSGFTAALPAQVAAGAFHCMAVKNDGTLWAWGRNTYGNLGDNTLTNRAVPVQMIGISNVAGLSAGTNFSIVAKSDGTFWGCGRNASGQLGDGTFLQRNVLTHSPLLCPVLISNQGEINATDAGINILPNPSANGLFYLEHIENISTMNVFDMLGKALLTIEHSGNKSAIINLSEYPAGIYLLKVVKKNNQIFHARLIRH